MGQYYKIANLDKKQFISPSVFGDGVKLMEFARSSSGTLTALAVLLASSNGKGGGDLHMDGKSPWFGVPGSWAGDRIVVAGDYDDDPESPGCGVYEACSEQEPPPLAQLVEANGERVSWEDISHVVLGCLLEDDWFRHNFLNLPARTPENERWLVYQDRQQRDAWAAARPGEPFPLDR
jgi:hypothetical protein